MKKLIIFTDGACWGNGKKNPKAGIGIHFPHQEYKDISLKFTKEPITNQRAELYAIYLVVHLLGKKDVLDNLKTTIYTDSMYSINCVTKWYKKWKKNGWKTANGDPVANQTLIKGIVKYLEKYDIKLEHVRSHTNGQDFESIHNDIADELATKAVKLQKGGSDRMKEGKTAPGKKVKVVLLND